MVFFSHLQTEPLPSSKRPLDSDRLLGIRVLAKTIAIALASYALSLFFFAPRFAYWRGLHVEQASVAPEVNRAIDSIAQLHEPLNTIANGSNIVLQWRLFFPLLGHLLHLSVPVYLAIPHVGCFVTLCYVALIGKRFFYNDRHVFFLTTLTATASWFFVSTGWLSYEDAWNIFGLLLVTFTHSRAILIVTCLYEPFIDERFILAIPLILVLRVILETEPGIKSATESGKMWRRRILKDALVILLPIAPYVLLRLIVLSHDRGSIEYLTKRLSELHDPVSFTQYLLGFWMGLRLMWLSVLGLIIIAFSPRRLVTGQLFLLALGFSVAIALVIAADLSRSMSIMVPAGVVGTLLLMRRFPRQMNVALPAMMIGNLLLPACHVVTLFNVPIFYLYESINECVYPPPLVNAVEYARVGEAAAVATKFTEAVKLLDSSLRLDPRSAFALTTRALAKTGLNDFAGATADVQAALQIDPKSPTALYCLRMISAKQTATMLSTTRVTAPATVGASP